MVKTLFFKNYMDHGQWTTLYSTLYLLQIKILSIGQQPTTLNPNMSTKSLKYHPQMTFQNELNDADYDLL